MNRDGADSLEGREGEGTSGGTEGLHGDLCFERREESAGRRSGEEGSEQDEGEFQLRLSTILAQHPASLWAICVPPLSLQRPSR